MCERSLAESRRTGKQGVVEHFTPLACSLDRHSEHFLDSFLTDELPKRARAQREIEFSLVPSRLYNWSLNTTFFSWQFGLWSRARRRCRAVGTATFHR